MKYTFCTKGRLQKVYCFSVRVSVYGSDQFYVSLCKCWDLFTSASSFLDNIIIFSCSRWWRWWWSGIDCKFSWAHKHNWWMHQRFVLRKLIQILYYHNLSQSWYYNLFLFAEITLPAILGGLKSKLTLLTRKTSWQMHYQFTKTQFYAIRPLRVCFKGQPVIDTGGPGKECYSQLYDKLLESAEFKLFERPPGHIIPSYSITAVFSGMMKILGTMLAHSIAQCGTGMPVLSPVCFTGTLLLVMYQKHCLMPTLLALEM